MGDSIRIVVLGLYSKSHYSIKKIVFIKVFFLFFFLKGDSGVGKTLFCHSLSNTPVQQLEWTIGCNAFSFSHDFKGRSYSIELLDVGGSSVYSLSRKLFYNDIDGIV